MVWELKTLGFLLFELDLWPCSSWKVEQEVVLQFVRKSAIRLQGVVYLDWFYFSGCFWMYFYELCALVFLVICHFLGRMSGFNHRHDETSGRVWDLLQISVNFNKFSWFLVYSIRIAYLFFWFYCRFSGFRNAIWWFIDFFLSEFPSVLALF